MKPIYLLLFGLLSLFAFDTTYPPDVACATPFSEAEHLARERSRFVDRHRKRAELPPSYPTGCIPPPLPDLDCKDIPHKNFVVIGEDPHRFDGDNDGFGCEN